MLAAGLVAVVLTSSGTDLTACGDKFLRIGRSARFRGYAATHPASILFYKPRNSTAAGVQEFEALLKRAGHKPLTVENGSGLSQIFAAASYDIVIADYADAGKLKEELRSVPSNPGLLPILYKPTKAVAAGAQKEYQCLIKPETMTKYDALAEIDRLMVLRQKGTTAAGPAK